MCKNCACDIKPSSKTKKTASKTTAKKTATKKTATKTTVKKTASKTTAKKTVKAPVKKKVPAKKTAVKTVKKPVAKPTAKKTSAPPVKVTPLGRYIDGIILNVPQPIPTAVRTILPTDSVFEWYVRTWPDDDLALEIDHRLKFAQVKKAMGTSAIYKVIGVGDSVVRERIETGIRELYRDSVPANLTQALMTAKKTPAKKTASKTVSCGCAVTPAKPSKPKTVTCGCAQTPAQVKKAILNKAEKEGMNRKELDKHIIVAAVPGIEAKEPIKPPASWKVPAVGGKFEGSAPAKSTAKTPAKKTSAKKNVAVPGSRGVQGRFDAGALKAVAQFIHKMDKDLDMPIFSNDTQFVDSGRIMALRLVSRMPGKSFVGLPLDPSKRDQAVPMESFIKRLNASVMDVYYQDGRLYYSWKNSPGLSVSTAVHESNNPRTVKFVWSRTRTEGDIIFRTSQAKFAKDVHNVVESSGVRLPKMWTSKTSYKDTAMSMCPPNGAVGYDEDGHIPPQCAGYSMYRMNQIAGLVAKAKGSQCIVMFKPNFPLRIVCDLGPYMAEIMLAPVYTGD